MEKGGLVSQAVPKKSGAFFGRSRQNQLEQPQQSNSASNTIEQKDRKVPRLNIEKLLLSASSIKINDPGSPDIYKLNSAKSPKIEAK